VSCLFVCLFVRSFVKIKPVVRNDLARNKVFAESFMSYIFCMPFEIQFCGVSGTYGILAHHFYSHTWVYPKVSGLSQ
jgi:hypothetical protein